MRVLGLHHAQVTVAPEDEEAARRFYCEILALPEVQKPDSLHGRGGFWVQAGDRQVHIGIEAGVDRSATKAHLAYEVDDLAAWRSHLEGAGIEPIDSAPIPGFHRFECRDPFGNRLELIQSNSAGTAS